MKKQNMAFAVVSIAVLCAVTAVNANRICGTPLYTARMEQVSSKMNFLPTTVNDLVYTAKEGCTVMYGTGYGAAFKVPAGTCYNTCGDTCPATCETCYDTCGKTCPATCETCWDTCPVTGCTPCGDTLPETCPDTCETCYNTCGNTCAVTSCTC